MAAKLETQILAFNRGLVSRLALGRLDLKRMAWSAETMTNWAPRKFGSMMLRPGLQYRYASNGNLATRNIEFVRSLSAMAILEFTDSALRIIIDDVPLTRVAVTSAVSNGDFGANLAGWTDNDAGTAVSDWVVGGYMGLTGDGTNAAIRDQTVTVPAASQNVEHALRIIVKRGPVTLRVGTSTSDDSYVNETTLQTGAHSIAFTPTGDFNIRFMSTLERQVLVDSCNVESAGIVSIPSPYLAADLDAIRGGPDSQSVDVMFLACTGYTQRRVERRAARSWSLVQYLSEDGPFNIDNTTPITITPSGLTGNITLTASAPTFKSAHAPSANNAGALFRISSQGQNVSKTITAQNTFSDPIRVTGITTQRIYTLAITGLSATGSTVTQQVSFTSEDGPWIDVSPTYVADTSAAQDDGLNNQIAWYRVGVKTGDYVAGTIVVSLSYTNGSIDGIARVTSFTSSTVVNAEVLTAMGATSASDTWAEGAWSDENGWPSAGALYESRMIWAGNDKFWAAVTDAFDSFDDSTVGDSGPFSRSIGSGPVETINWILPMQRLMVGAQMAEFACRSSALDEPLTPTNFNIKATSRQGSAPVQAKIIEDNSAVLAQRGGSRLYSLEFGAENFNYQAKDLTALNPQVCQPRIVRIAVQNQPDTRIHCVLSDGTVAMLVYDPAENVMCWCKIETDGLIEDAVVLPGGSGDVEDKVYYTVARSINGATVRYVERWALESECVGGTLNKQADSFITFTGPTTTVTAAHLAGADVVVWQDGVCPEDTDGFPKIYTADASGVITLDSSATSGIVGLAYEASWKGTRIGEVLSNMKRIVSIAPILADTHPKGLYYGSTLDRDDMDTLPEVQDGEIIDTDATIDDYDDEPISFDGPWKNDARLCLMAFAPRPCTLVATRVIGEKTA